MTTNDSMTVRADGREIGSIMVGSRVVMEPDRTIPVTADRLAMRNRLLDCGASYEQAARLLDAAAAAGASVITVQDEYRY